MIHAETHRPHFHFTPGAMWMNDPNGLVYADGEYHLFYQHEPRAMTCTGVMDWGHAVSRDLVNWRELPVAITHDELGWAWSGSAVLDRENRSGLGTAAQPPLVAIYTQHLVLPDQKYTERQSLAFSLDAGRSWTKYPGNPVIGNPGNPDFRDPKVLWHEPGGHWVAVIASQFQTRFYRSRDLKRWEATGIFASPPDPRGRFWECPDLFPIRVAGTDQEKWVLIQNTSGGPNGGSVTRYYLGHFDGKTFVSETPPETPLWFDYGPDNYAGITWDNAPDARRLFIGWMSNWEYAQAVPTDPWRGAMTVPRELRLQETPAGLRLFQEPVAELRALRKSPQPLAAATVEAKLPLPGEIATAEIELTFDLARTAAPEFGVEFTNPQGETLRVGFDRERNRFVIDRTHAGKTAFHEKFAAKSLVFAPREATDAVLRLRLLLDAASVELFADNGQTAMSAIFFPHEDFNQASLYAKNGRAAFSGGTVWPLGDIRVSRCRKAEPENPAPP